MLPAWLNAWLRPLSALKPFCLAIPSVMPVTAGTIAALASDCATCENVTAQKFCEIRMIADASTTQMPGITTHIRLLRLASMKPPIGVGTSMPPTLPIVIAVPISPVAQPRSWRKTPTKGPMPDCMSAMKKLRANRGQIRDEEGDRDVIDTKTWSQPGCGGWDMILSANRSGADESLTSADRVGSRFRPVGGACGHRRQFPIDVGSFLSGVRHAPLDLRNLRRAISGWRKSANVLSDLRGRTAIRRLERTDFPHARGALGTSPHGLARRSRPDRPRTRAKLCHRPARAAGAARGRLADVGLRPAGDAGGDRACAVTRRPEGDRDLASALLWRARRLERGVWRGAGLFARR